MSQSYKAGLAITASIDGQEKVAALSKELDGLASATDRAEEAAKGAKEQVGALGGESEILSTKLTGVAGAVAGAFALDQVLGFAAALAPIADAAKNLEGRMRLAVGETGNLEAALEEVRSSANATGSDINAVGDLFGSLARSTQSLGASQAEVATLTDTINKSFAISNTSAAAASGAITQLSQAFATGALRGDEFNSVNAAAPRLMDAVAAGLGVAREELKTLADQGKLTTEALIKALQSQAAVINAEFITLPETVGRATQRMANEWQVFVGKLDQLSGASETVAEGLTLISDNLDSIAGVAATTGEVVVAALAVKAAAALRGYIGLTAASTVATNAHSVAIGALAAAGRAATLALFTLGRSLKGLGVAGVVAGVGALVAEFAVAEESAEDVAAAVEKALSEPPANAVAEEFRLVATEAEALRFKVSEVEKSFQALRAKGMDTAKALSSLAQATDISSVEGITKLTVDLDLLRQGAYATGEQIQAAIADKLRSITAQELVEFGMQAELAFSRGKISAEQFALALDAQARAALLKLGIDADAALSGMGGKFTEAASALQVLVGQFDRLALAGVDAGAAIEGALAVALKSAQNPKEFEYLNALVVKLGKEGKLAGEAVTAALESIQRKADDATPGIQSVEEAFRRLGVTSKAEMDRAAAEAKQAFEVIRDSGKATAEELRAAFTAYAEQAVAANGGVADATVKAQASALGLAVEVDKTGKVIVQSMAEAAFGVKGAGQALQDAADSARELGEAAGEAGESMVEAARAQNAAVKSVTVSLVDATTAQSRYADEAKRVASAVYNSALDQANSFRASAGAIDGARAAARLYIEEMERLDARQQEFSSSAAEGVEQLRLRLLELNGTEEQIASARQSRDQAEVLRTIELTRLDLRRAELRKDAGEAERLQREINLLQEQLGLIDQIYRAERRNRSQSATATSSRGGASGAVASGAATSSGVQAVSPTFAAPRQTTLNINLPQSGLFSGDRASLEAFARQLGPVITDLQRRGAL